MATQDRLFTQMFQGTAPLLVWAAHFFFCYAYTAAACTTGAERGHPGSDPVNVLALASLLAAVATGTLLWRAVRQLDCEAAGDRLLDWAKVGSAVLALIGILWTSVPMFMLDACAWQG
jgi:hypothetical protein